MSPLRRGLIFGAGILAVTAGGGALSALWLPDVDGTTRALLVVTVLFAASLAVAPRFGTWADLGVNRPEVWRHQGLLVVPALVAVSPLAVGVDLPGGDTLLVLVVGYALTGVTEELLWRGVCQRVLAPLGPARGVLLTAALFGTVHLSNVFFRDNVALVLAQAWGAFCFGVGYGAVRARIGTIVPLMVLHFVTDLAAAVGALPKIPMLVAEDVVLLTLGLVLLRRGVPDGAGPVPHAVPAP
jgi:membrane protease YdiL (CAAX protease family)